MGAKPGYSARNYPPVDASFLLRMDTIASLRTIIPFFREITSIRNLEEADPFLEFEEALPFTNKLHA